MPDEIGERLRIYFRLRAEEIGVQAKYAICQHAGLIGGHREAIQRTLFEHLLPRRFSVGRGMVYGTHHRSREADIVIWDSMNYPSIPMADHAMYFAESVRAVLECKSRFSRDEFRDVCLKAGSVRAIVPAAEDTPGIAVRLEMVEQRTLAMLGGETFLGMMQHSHQIGTAAIFLTGGGDFDFKGHGMEVLSAIDDTWPDIVLLLEPGVIICKEYEVRDGFMGGVGRASKYVLGEDSLLVFLSLLMGMLFDRATALEPPLDILRYVPSISVQSEWSLSFPLTRVVPHNHPFIHPPSALGVSSPTETPDSS